MLKHTGGSEEETRILAFILDVLAAVAAAQSDLLQRVEVGGAERVHERLRVAAGLRVAVDERQVLGVVVHNGARVVVLPREVAVDPQRRQGPAAVHVDVLVHRLDQQVVHAHLYARARERRCTHVTLTPYNRTSNLGQ